MRYSPWATSRVAAKVALGCATQARTTALKAHRRKSAPVLPPLEECLQPCLRPTQNQRMNVVGAFVGIHGFQVH